MRAASDSPTLPRLSRKEALGVSHMDNDNVWSSPLAMPLSTTDQCGRSMQFMPLKNTASGSTTVTPRCDDSLSL